MRKKLSLFYIRLTTPDIPGSGWKCHLRTKLNCQHHNLCVPSPQDGLNKVTTVRSGETRPSETFCHVLLPFEGQFGRLGNKLYNSVKKKCPPKEDIAYSKISEKQLGLEQELG